MTKNNVKKVIVSLIAILLVVGVACTVYASEGNIMDEIGEMLQNEKGNIANNENAEQILEGNTSSNKLTNTNTNNTVNENLPETTPHAGVGDYSGLIFVAIFAVSAIYAYKKVRDYKA